MTKSWVYLMSNKDFIFLETYSGLWSCLPDPSGEQIFLPASVSETELGTALIKALDASCVVDPVENPEFYDVMGRVVPQYSSWVGSVMGKYGYKTRRAMFKDMKNCAVEMEGGVIVIKPSHHEKLEAWSGKGLTVEDYVSVSSSVEPSELGAGVYLALSRCT